MSGKNNAWHIYTGDFGMHTYETRSMDAVKIRANAGRRNLTSGRQLVGCHNNPVSNFRDIRYVTLR